MWERGRGGERDPSSAGYDANFERGEGKGRLRVGGWGGSEEEGGSANERSVEWTWAGAEEMDVAGRMEVRCLFERRMARKDGELKLRVE